MKQRFYIDTSVWGGPFDKEFEMETNLLFDLVKTAQISCLYSDITENELMKAPENVRSFFETFPVELKEKAAITPEILSLAKTYVNENVVGKTSYDDCVHIATADKGNKNHRNNGRAQGCNNLYTNNAHRGRL
jgi:predicted nucleic acid-binding protein